MELHKHLLEGEYVRDVWIAPGPQNESHPLCLFLDAEHYIRDLQAFPIIEELSESGSIPPATFVFVSHVSGAARHEDYACSDRYSKFIEEDVVAWAREQAPGIRANDNLIGGLSLSGLAAAHIALRRPDLFSYVLAQSGSFWWLADNPIEMPTTHSRFWLSVGDEETATEVSHPPTGLFQRVSQIEGVHSMAERLETLGATVNVNVYSGGHAAAPWRAELVPALTWLFDDGSNTSN